MTDARDALDRTLRIARNLIGTSLSDDRVLQALLATEVALVADERNLATASGQACLTTLFGLTAAYGCRITLLVPPVPITGHQPPLRGSNLVDALLDLGGDLIPGVEARTSQQTTDRDLVFVLGDSPWSGAARMAWRLSGSSWSGSTQSPEVLASPWQANLPIGALTAAVIAAAEPFKDALRRLVPAGTASLPRWDTMTVPSAGFDFGDLLGDGQVETGAIDFISGGAITNACLHALLRVPTIRGAVRVIEPELLDLSNLNRYSLARRSDIRKPKVDIIQRHSVTTYPISTCRETVTKDTLDVLRPLAPRVAVGVDNLTARWLVQGEWPAWLTVGATADFMAMSSEHRPGTRCAGCLHDRDDGVIGPIPTVSFVSYWAGLMLAVRILRQAAGQSEWQGRKVLTVYPLRLDSPSAILWRPVPLNPGCPVECARYFPSDNTPRRHRRRESAQRPRQ